MSADSLNVSGERSDPHSTSTSESESIARLDPKASPLRSQSTDTLPEILSKLGVSLLVSTYQAGYVVAVRASGPKQLNTHFRRFPRPMGMSHRQGRLAIGTDREVVEFWNMPAVCPRLEPPEGDACFLPRKSHFTGHIDIHELAWGQEGLWFVNTLFSCLCTLDAEHSFVPRWWPKFVTGLASEDRCHLNGIALRDGKPAFVTCHSIADTPQGWREHKKDGGILIDVASGEVVLQGLAMPHSPRWYDGRLWLLESGDGSLGHVDLKTGKYEAIARFDGFTRGLSFWGPCAFIGLSQVRESAIFSGIPIAQRLQDKERICGVGVVHLPSARVVAWVHFLDAVQEVFAVEVVPYKFPDLLEPSDPLVASTYSLPDEALRHVSRSKKAAEPIPNGELPAHR
jgi:uncharacterized protein (TIGR03032 family)